MQRAGSCILLRGERYQKLNYYYFLKILSNQQFGEIDISSASIIFNVKLKAQFRFVIREKWEGDN